MPYWGDSFINGFSAGQDMRDRRLRRQQEALDRTTRSQELEAERQLKLRMAADGMAHEDNLTNRRLKAEADRLASSQLFGQSEAERDRAWRAGEGTRQREWEAEQILKRLQAENSTDLPRNRLIEAQIKEAEARAGAYQAKAEPTAELETMSPDGQTKIRTRIPAAEALGKLAPATPVTSSPYSSAIADAERVIAENRMAQADGDNRTGILNWKSRSGVIDENQRRLARLKALEIQSRLESGQITQEQADQESKKFLPQ